MADPYRHRRHELKAAIIERVDGGTPLRIVLAAPGMPEGATVRNWRAADPGFAQAMVVALSRGQWRRKSMFDEARAAAFLARYRAGEPIRHILRDPAMPSRQLYNRWLAHAPFAEEVHRLKAVHEPNRMRGLRTRRRDFDPALARRVLEKVARGGMVKALRTDDPTMPSLKLLGRWRRENPAFDEALRLAIRAGGRYGRRMRGRCARLTPLIVARLRESGSLHSLAADPKMPCVDTMYRWVRERPDFRAAVAQAYDDREDRLSDQILEIARTVQPGTVMATRRRMSPLVRQLGRNRPGRRWR